MELSSNYLPESLLWWAMIGYGAVLLKALLMAPWYRFRDAERLNLFLGSCVALIMLWLIRTNEMYGFVFHLLGVTTLTLMFGWSLAVILSSLALVAITWNQGGDWQAFPVNAFLLTILPITLTQFILVPVRSLLPKNYFIFVLVNGFLTGGLVAVVSGYAAVGLLVMGGRYDLAQLQQTVIPFFPLMFLPEAFFNGWITTLLISFRPQWVVAFSDELYIDGK